MADSAIELPLNDAAKKKLDSLLLQGIRSGQPIETDAEYWKAKRDRLRDFEHRRRETER